MSVRPVVACRNPETTRARAAAALLVVAVAALFVPAGRAQDAPYGIPYDELGAHRDTLSAGPPYRLRPFVRPATFRLYLDGVRADPARYRLDARAGALELVPPPPPGAVVVAVYRTWPVQAVYRRRVVSAPDSAGAVVVEATAPDVRADPFGNASLQRSGSITRGVVAGSGRDVSVESGLNVQLAGEVAPGVTVQAALTDENTPIQPEGTTQRLSEFDRVYIGIDAAAGTARLGDIDLRFVDSEFARYARKLQGAALTGRAPPVGAFVGGTVTAAGAASRGLFRRQTIQPLDGVQGPYRLEGASGEQFVIVVAGSETVFLDGRPLVRGASADYVIDYQTGELTFTPAHLMTDERRLVVEFQYTTSEYSRTTVASRAEAALWPNAAGAGRARVGATFIREADARRLNTELGFSPGDSLLIARAGDAQAFRSGAQRVAFDPEAPFVQYVRELRPVAGGVDTAYVPVSVVPPPGTDVYRVSFTRVGAGRGRYVRVGRAVNGLLFEYRGPGMGDYEPVRLLPRPEQRRLIDLQGVAEPLPGVEVFGEWARSLDDANRLSDLDAADDVGGARLVGVRLVGVPLEVRGVEAGRLAGEMRHRRVGAHFAAFERVRPVDFARTWNLRSRALGGVGEVEAGDERIDEGRLRLSVTPRSFVGVEGGRLRLGDAFYGTRGEAAVAVAEPGLPEVAYTVAGVRSEDRREAQAGTWVRQDAALRVPFLDRRFVPGVEVEHEHLRQRVLGTDSLVAFPRAEAFVEVRPGVAWTSDKLTASGGLTLRRERDVAEGVLRDAARAYGLRGTLGVRPATAFTADADVAWRRERVADYFRRNEGRADHAAVAVRLNSRWTPWDRTVDAGLFYEAQTERTPTLQELFVRTGPEFGEYVWEDGNGDGLVQVDEFVPERTPNEGTYVKTLVPSDSLAPTVGVQARFKVGLDPWRRWRGATGLRRALAAVQTVTTLEVLEKNSEPDVTRLYLLDLSRFRQPGATLNGRLRASQELILFARDPRYRVNLRLDDLRALTRLTSGEETRLQRTVRADGHVRAGDRWAFRLRGAVGRNRAESGYASRQYDITSLSVEPEATYRVSSALQFTGGVSHATKDDGVGARRAQVWRLPVEGRYTRARRVQLSARAEAAHVALDGEATGLAQYELTDGRGPGTSFLWHLSGHLAVNTYLNALLTYDGRAPSGAPTLHTVRVQLSATF